MNEKKIQILEALSSKHMEMIKTDKLDTVKGGIILCIEVEDG